MSNKPPDLHNRYMNTDLSSNMEDYIETIAILAENSKVVRVKDIAKMLHIKMPSVTSALIKLKEIKLIEYEKYGYIELTAEGKYLAERIYHRHMCLTEFFKLVMKLDPGDAERIACKMEHDISAEACTKLHKFLEFYKEEDGRDKDWTKRLKKCLDK